MAPVLARLSWSWKIDGIKCISAADGREAVNLARQARPDLILMDIQLPVLSGIDATQEMKIDPDLADIPIIAMTAKAMKGEREKILADGCDDYLSKPIDLHRLKEVLAKWLHE